MARIELLPIDADSFEARLEQLHPVNPDTGKPIAAWHNFAHGNKVNRQRLQDGHNAQDTQLKHHKVDIDDHARRLEAVEARLRVIEEAPAPRPFP